MTTKRGKDGDEGNKPIGKWIGIGAAAGIGSAAIAAALIYANRSRKEQEAPKGPKEDSED